MVSKKKEKSDLIKPSRRVGGILETALIIQDQDVLDANELGILNRALVQCSLPHSDPGNQLEVWSRNNGNTNLTIQPHRFVKDGEVRCAGYPFGVIPRLLLIYLATEAQKTQCHEIGLGNSLSSFMRSLGLDVNGDDIKRFKDQMWRLFSASIKFTYDSEEVKAASNASVADEVVLWWDEKRPTQNNLLDSYVVLNQQFLNDIISHPVPLDLRAVRALRQSPLALDLYLWLTHRVSYLERSQRISWMSLSDQVGANYKNVRELTRYAKAEICKIQALWPYLKIEYQRGGFVIHPTQPHVPQKTIVTFPLLPKKVANPQ